MNIRTRIIAPIAALTLSLGLGALGTQPAAAANSTLKICNSSHSSHYISAWDIDEPIEKYIQPGYCATMEDVGDTRVDVDPYDRQVYPYLLDIDSYQLGVIGEGYGPCHASENNASNPPNDAPDGVRYKTFPDNHCG